MHVRVVVYSCGVGVMCLGVLCGDHVLGGCRPIFGVWLGGPAREEVLG